MRLEELCERLGRPVSRETYDRLSRYADLVLAESSRQNLVSAATLGGFWERHIVDSAQLIRFAGGDRNCWADVGAGAGLPGIVIACFDVGSVTLIEPRRLRAEFLRKAVGQLGLNATVQNVKAGQATGKFDIITARAVAPLSKFLGLSGHLSTEKTRFILPKGKSVEFELAQARKDWQALFHVEQSLSGPEGKIVLVDRFAGRRR